MAQSLASDSMHSSGKLPPTLTPIGQFAGKPTLPISRSVTLIGSRKQARLQLISSTVSQNHALIVVAESGPYVRDLASRSHVLINDREVRESALADGDELSIGRFTFRFNASPGVEKGPREVRHAGEGRLTVDGADMPVPIEGRTLLIGRRETCDIHLLEKSVSTTHAVIFEIDGRRYIRDLISRTGTFVNNKQIHQVELMSGDAIRIGDTLLHYEASEATTSVQEPPDLAAQHEDLSDLVDLEPDEIVPVPEAAKEAAKTARPASPIDVAPRRAAEAPADADIDSGLELIQDQPIEPEPVVAESESLQVESAEASEAAEPPQDARELAAEPPEEIEIARAEEAPALPIATEPVADIADEIEIEPIAEAPTAPEPSKAPASKAAPPMVERAPERVRAAAIELSSIDIAPPADEPAPVEATKAAEPEFAPVEEAADIELTPIEAAPPDEEPAPVEATKAAEPELSPVEEAADIGLSPIETAPPAEEPAPVEATKATEPELAPVEAAADIEPAPIEIPAEFAGVEPATESPIASEPSAAPAPEPGIPPAPVAPPGVMSIDQAKLESEPLIAAGNEPAAALAPTETAESIQPEPARAEAVAPPIETPAETPVEALADEPTVDSAITAAAKVEAPAASATPIAPLVETVIAESAAAAEQMPSEPAATKAPTNVTTKAPMKAPTKAPAPRRGASVKSGAKKKSSAKKPASPVAPTAAIEPVEPVQPIEPVEPIEATQLVEPVAFDEAAADSAPIPELSFDSPASVLQKPAVESAELASMPTFDAGGEIDSPALSEEEMISPLGDVSGGDFSLTDETAIDSPLDMEMAIDQPLDVDDVFAEQASDLDLGLEPLAGMDEIFAPDELEPLPDFESGLETPQIVTEPPIDLAIGEAPSEAFGELPSEALSEAPSIDQPVEEVKADEAPETKPELESAEQSPVASPVAPLVEEAAEASSAVTDDSSAEVIAATEATPESALAIDEAVAPVDDAGEAPAPTEEVSLSDTGFGRAVEAFAEPSTGAIVEEPAEETAEAASDVEPQASASAPPAEENAEDAEDIELLPVEHESSEPAAHADESIIDVEAEEIENEPVESKASAKLFDLEPATHEPASVQKPAQITEPAPAIEIDEKPAPEIEEPAAEIEVEPVEASFGPSDVKEDAPAEEAPAEEAPSANAGSEANADTAWDEDLDLEALAAESADLPKVQSRFGPGASQLDFEPLTDAELGLSAVEVKRDVEVQPEPPRAKAAPAAEAAAPQAAEDEASLEQKEEVEASLEQQEEVETPATIEPAAIDSATIESAETPQEIAAEEITVEEMPAEEAPAKVITPLEIPVDEIILEETPSLESVEEPSATETAPALAQDESLVQDEAPAPVAEAPAPVGPAPAAPIAPASAPVDRPSEPGDASYNWGANQEHFLGGMPLELPPPPRRPQPAATANPMPSKAPPAPLRPVMRKPAAPQPR
ncbi:MAG TPA: FHA domain-containing protein, partial [Thermomicrobiales bacterium]|nr:FHA domain-containing protein [Thermomicrobiales bacterium]